MNRLTCRLPTPWNLTSLSTNGSPTLLSWISNSWVGISCSASSNPSEGRLTKSLILLGAWLRWSAEVWRTSERRRVVWRKERVRRSC